MKKILTSLALVGLGSLGAFAQKSVDLAFTLVQPAADFAMSCEPGDSTTLEFIIVNNGPDALTLGDTVFVKGPWNEENYVSVLTFADEEGNVLTVNAGDTVGHFAWNIHSSEVLTLADPNSFEWVYAPFASSQNYLFALLSGSFSASFEDPITENNGGTVNVTWCPSTSIQDQIALNKSMSVFPNPAQNQINVQFDFNEAAHATVRISDITGRVVLDQDFGKQTPGIHSFSIDASSLNNGMYNIELIMNNQRAISKLTINK